MTLADLIQRYPRGTWVSFMRDNQIVISEVYGARRSSMGSRNELITLVGAVDPDAVIEKRMAQQD